MSQQPDFATFVAESYPTLLRRAFLLVGDHGHAEDLVQTALTTAYPRWRRIREPHAYLRKVMVRTAIGWRRRRWSGEVPTANLPEVAGGLDEIDERMTTESVRRALLALPPPQRAVVVLRYFDGCSEAEIAAALGCSPGTVKSRSSRALAALRADGLLSEAGRVR